MNVTTAEIVASASRFLSGGGDGVVGIHVPYEDVWFAMLFLSAIWIFGFLGERILLMPSLVGQIFAGIICGPALLDIVPLPEAFVLLGEIGLVLLVIEAGVDIDVTTLKLIGKRGVIIATLGSVFPIAFGIGIAFALGADTKAAIAAGAAFGPTSLGIAMNILRSGKIINTPTGQLIVAAAIIDDMIALIILSQLGGLVGEITVVGVVQPIATALGFLLIGGYLALFVLPPFLERYIFKESMDPVLHGKLALFLMLALVMGLFQATMQSKASHLMGAFIAGLVFCTDHELHVSFVSQFKRILQWLMRIFFASTIGFQVPVKNFANGTVIWKGLVFTLALIGKLGVGFMVPNFTQSRNFTGNHLRDCLIVGCSMAAEGEFAFVIAAFSVEKGIIDIDLYSSIVLAILLSTIIAPFSLRLTINYYNKKNMKELEAAEELQAETGDVDDDLRTGILKGSTVFFCVNTTCHSTWGTLPKLMQCLFDLKLDFIDHRSWHSKFEDGVINEVYCKGRVEGGTDLDEFIQTIFDKVTEAVDQKDAMISVSRWTPGFVDDLVESDNGEVDDTQALTRKLAREASKRLDKSAHKAEKTDQVMLSVPEVGVVAPIRKRRVRIVSTPVGGGDMFAEPGALPASATSVPAFQPLAPVGGASRRRRHRTLSSPVTGDMFGDTTPVVLGPGEVLANIVTSAGKKHPVKMDEKLLKKVCGSQTPLVLMEEKKETSFVGNYLDGFIRKDGRSRALSVTEGV